MSRQTFVFDHATGKVVPKGTETARRRADGLQIIRDFSDPLLNPADGQHYSSRRTYEAATRRAGAVEIGHAEHRKLTAGYLARGRQGHDTMPSVESSIRESMDRMGL